MKPSDLRVMIREVLLEEVQKKNFMGNKNLPRLPEMNGNGVNKDNKGEKTFGSDENTKDKKTKPELVDQLTKVVNSVNSSFTVIWDDHDDIMINGRDLINIRIIPKWEDSYNIEILIKNEDRIYIMGQSWNQVIELIKTNLKQWSKNPTAVEKAYDKSYRNRKDEVGNPDKGMPTKDKPDTLPLTSEESTTKDQVQDDTDLPTSPMKPADDFKKLADYKSQPPVKVKKKKPDTKLGIKWK